ERRWLHVITGIAWIGTSFFFIWLDLSLRKNSDTPAGVQGDSWMVHGGGVYRARKYLSAPGSLPKELHWFKYEAYFTWLSGMALLAVIYYWGAESYLIDPAVADLTTWQAIGLSLAILAGGWILYDVICRSPLGRDTRLLAALVFVLSVGGGYLLTELFSGRAAFLHIGAMLGTIMVGNVFFIIIPNQKKTVRALVSGDTPDPALGMQAKQRSLHNNYLTLPVVLMMISNHYPMIFGAEYSWVVAGVFIVLGAVIRDYFNRSHAGGEGWSIRWQWPTAGATVIALFLALTLPWAQSWSQPENGALIATARAVELTNVHCVSCHATVPSHESFDAAPGGVALESLDEIKRHAARMVSQIETGAMPLGNETEMTEIERLELSAWLKAAPWD
ncbi:MAG: urate hydroxylase PuuD, partial [Pseudomonadota bacterium]